MMTDLSTASMRSARARVTSADGVEDCDAEGDEDGDWLFDCADDDCVGVCDADRDGYITELRGGLDCDDNAFDVNPGAQEVPYTGLDEDCNPNTPDDDIDGDGFLLADDCNDANGNTWPGAPETCGDGRDQRLQQHVGAQP